jgi:hypothetical protein
MGMAGYIEKNPNFDTWKKNFLADLEAGRITPSMRKVRVRPFGEEEIVILAYARDHEGCQRVVQKRSKGSLWDDVGYIYSLLFDHPEGGNANINGIHGQTEMLLYRNRPLFVKVYEFTWNERPPIAVFRFDERMSKLEKGKYWFGDLCNFQLDKE